MENHPPSPTPFRDTDLTLLEWLTEPQTLIALSAVLLSVCGLFISIYETSLVREQQRASVWPRLEVGPSLNDSSIAVRVRNVGIGPARVRAAAVTRQGERQVSWVGMLRSDSVNLSTMRASRSVNLLNGRVLAPGDDITAFALDAGGADAAQYVNRLTAEVLRGRLDVAICYCSVYDECWVTALQDILPDADQLGMDEVLGPGLPSDTSASPEGTVSLEGTRSSGETAATGLQPPRPVETCDAIEPSAI